MKYVLGVDFGGGAGKGTLLSEEGKVIAVGMREYKTYTPFAGWTEIHAEDYYEAFCGIVKDILLKSKVDKEDIVALAISSASQTSAYLDENDVSVRPSIYWTDNRSLEEEAWLRKEYGDKIYDMGHNVASSSRSLTHLIWIRKHEPENFKRIKKVMFMKDYVRYRLTGDFVTDYIDAMGSHLMDTPNNCWSKELMDLAGVTEDMLPQILSPTDIVGCISKEAAADCGLSVNTQVAVGTTDTVMEVYANGAIHEGQMTLKLATAGRICVVADRNIPNKMLLNYKHVVPGMWYPGSATKACASSYRWYRDSLCAHEMSLAENAGKDAYEIMDEMASKVEPGSGNLFFHPYLQGEATPYFDNLLKASFVGVTMFHKKEHFTRALLEGVAYSLKDSLEPLLKEGIECSQAIIIGGGSKSPLWRQIVADVLNIRLTRTEDSDSSLGTAMLAGVATGVFTSFDDSVKKCVKVKDGVTLPNPENVAIYEKCYETYKDIQAALEPVYHKLAGK